MSERNPTGDFLQFTIGGCLFGSGVFLFLNQVMVRSAWESPGLRGGWGGFRSWGSAGWPGAGLFPVGTPGLGLVMIPLALGVCLLFAGSYQRWARLLVWGSLAMIFAGVLNSIRITFMPATLWQLLVYVVMIASGGGLMFRSLGAYGTAGGPRHAAPPGRDRDEDEAAALRRDIAELRRRLDDAGR